MNGCPRLGKITLSDLSNPATVNIVPVDDASSSRQMRSTGQQASDLEHGMPIGAM